MRSSSNRARKWAPTRRPTLEWLEQRLMLAADSMDDADHVEVLVQTASHVGSSPFDPPKADDNTFTVDQGSGLDNRLHIP